MSIFNLIYKQSSRVCIHQITSKRFKYQRMNEVYCRHIGDSNRFEVSFKISHKNINRQFNFNRLLSENVGDFLARIRTNVEKVLNPKVKKKKLNPDEAAELLEVNLIQDGEVVDTTQQCKSVIFDSTNNLLLNIVGETFKVIVNPPWVESLSLPQSLMVGSYCYPSKLEIIFGDPDNSIFEWYKCDRNSSQWIEIGSSTKLLYLSEEYLHFKLKLRCIPSDGKTYGPEVEVMTNAIIKEGPNSCPFMARQAFTKESLPDGSFRVVSYNILAEVYAETVTAKQELFPYCPPFALNIDYRKQLYMREIIGYNADIICLQEVDVRIFKNDLSPVLEELGYQGVLSRKSGTVAEGVATFFAKRKFRLAEVKELSFGDAVDKDPIFNDIWNAIKNNEPVVKNMKERSTVFHAVILENGDKTFVVGNTHLFFFPSADHIRLLQGGMASLYLESIVNNLQSLGKDVCLLFCGDMNSTPDCGLYSLMTKKIAPASLPDWKSDKSEIVEGFDITQPFEMKSAYGEPKFTNYTVGFSGCLDYIYFQSDKLKLLQTVPLPSEDEVKVHTALPSPLFPSDHVALIADFEWIKKE
ncbi:2',5'-phosphodiesterase 12 [Halyomorpha halys]|uniref:2',5'-phosphodiesterase 12 n=1 Tax=Halyomorpha halys TaxID=286706 RepID=UPI0006D5297B|nr:2',5'-phosphodiesterase 12 [Halyomorpha halys]